jgi:hypothetical protein
LNTGEYTLTVFPKIYRRSHADQDVCQRIDLPPATVSFRVEEGQRK